MVREQVLRRAILRGVEMFAPRMATAEFKAGIRRLAGERRSTAIERHLFAEIIRQPALRGAFKQPGQSDFTPRLRVSAVTPA
jgi:hypothetical protein